MSEARAPLSPRAAVALAAAVTTLCAVAIVGLDHLAVAVPASAGWIGVGVALVFLGLPLVLERLGLSWGDPYLLQPGRARGAVVLGLLASVVVLLPFALAYDQAATQLWGEGRGHGAGLRSRGVALQGAPPAAAQRAAASDGYVVIFEHRGGLQLRNGLSAPITISPACAEAGCAAEEVAAGAAAFIADPAAAAFELHGADGAPLSREAVRLGRHGVVSAEGPLGAERGWSWWLWLLLDQLVVIALPEEALFRGWMLTTLRAAIPPRRRVLGVPFGWAHIVSAVLFACVHLAATAAPHRLLVFFPGLLFAWLAERARHLAAPVVHHALANTALTALTRWYG
jgi:hypothetical protein